MTIQELKSNYSSTGLSSFPGDNELRYKLFAPLLQNLHKDKIIYYEKFMGIVKLQDIKITPERFEATAIPYVLIERGNRFENFFVTTKSWTFRASWLSMRLIGESFSVPYAGWSIWCEPELVRQVEEFTLNKKFHEAMQLTLFKKRLSANTDKKSTKN